MIRLIILPLFSFLILATSCMQADIPLDLAAPDPKLAVTGYIQPDSAITLKLGRTFFIPAQPEYDLQDVTAEIFINGDYAGTLTEKPDQGDRSTHTFTSEVRPGYGDQVMVKVGARGMKPVCAKTLIPQQRPLITMDTVRIGKNKMEYRVRLEGRNELCYYRIFLFQYYDVYIDDVYYETSQRHQLWVDYYKDPVLQEEWGYAEEEYRYYDYHLFTNRSFIGRDYTLTMQSDLVCSRKFAGVHPETGAPAQIESRAFIVAKVLELSEDSYLHLKTLTAYKIDEGSDWIRVYSNVEEGIGVVGGYTESFVVTAMPEKAF
ncbi:MAG: DUF4249 family protein [Bacteroidales bacterium]